MLKYQKYDHVSSDNCFIEKFPNSYLSSVVTNDNFPSQCNFDITQLRHFSRYELCPKRTQPEIELREEYSSLATDARPTRADYSLIYCVLSATNVDDRVVAFLAS